MEAIKIIRVTGISIMFLDLGLRIAGVSGFAAFIGAGLLIGARLYQWHLTSRQRSGNPNQISN